MKYRDVNYAFSRLADTFIWHDDKLQRVRSPGVNSLVLEDRAGNAQDYKLSDINLAPPPLGYFNHGYGSCFVSRAALRRDYRQGMRRENLHFTAGDNPYETLPNSRYWTLFDLNKTVLGDYPLFSKALATVEEELPACGFGREYCLYETGEIGYRGRKIIGRVEQDDQISLAIHYLQEDLQELLSEQAVNIRLS